MSRNASTTTTTTTTLTRGQLARQSGVNFSTVRYYERRGILRSKELSTGGYHQYDEADVRLLRFVRRAQELGFTLKEVEELLTLRLDAGSHCDQVRQQAELKIDDMQRKIRDLEQMKNALAGLVEACKHNQTSDRCPMVEALEHD